MVILTLCAWLLELQVDAKVYTCNISAKIPLYV